MSSTTIACCGEAAEEGKSGKGQGVEERGLRRSRRKREKGIEMGLKVKGRDEE